MLGPVVLNDISVLVFEKGERTTSNRGEKYDQLLPQQGNEYQPDQVVCRNEGTDGVAPIWKCHAHIPQPYRFQSATVSCEGWAQPGDSKVVPGSCAL